MKIGRSYVYVIGSIVSGFYKIGISDNPEMRLSTLQSSNPMPLELIALRRIDNAKAEETRINGSRAQELIN